MRLFIVLESTFKGQCNLQRVVAHAIRARGKESLGLLMRAIMPENERVI